MYLHQKSLVTSHVLASIGQGKTPEYIDIEATVLHGHKNRSAAAGRLIGRSGRAIARGILAIARALIRRRQDAAALRELRRLDPLLLADIGLTPGEVEHAVMYGREIRRPAAPTLATPRAVANDGSSSDVRKAA